MTSSSAHRDAFTRIYEERAWGEGESISGPGSGLARTAGVRAALADLLSELHVQTLLDAGCGDFNWQRAVELPVRDYIGVEVVPELVNAVAAVHTAPGRAFVCADITRDPLPPADFVLCREVLMHFPDDDVLAALANLQHTGARWLLTTTFRRRAANDPIELGSWRPVNLEAPPFELPPPVRVLEDLPLVDRERFLDKRLALWELQKLL